MAFTSVTQLGRAMEITGKYHLQHFYKASIASPGAAGRYIDTSMSSGTPKYNAYVGSQLVATQLNGAGNDGIYTGPTPAAGEEKRILTFGASTTTATTPMTLFLMDYLLFYPLVDLDDIDLQVMDNTATLPRYTDGVGVRMMLVSSVQSTAATTMTVNYINQAGAQKTVTTQVITGTTNMLISSPSGASASPTPFIEFADGDTGVRAVESIQLASPPGGFANLVLVRPLVKLNLYEQNTYSEITMMMDKAVLPRVYDSSYLNIMSHNGANGSSAIRGDITFITR